MQKLLGSLFSLAIVGGFGTGVYYVFFKDKPLHLTVPLTVGKIVMVELSPGTFLRIQITEIDGSFCKGKDVNNGRIHSFSRGQVRQNSLIL